MPTAAGKAITDKVKGAVTTALRPMPKPEPEPDDEVQDDEVQDDQVQDDQVRDDQVRDDQGHDDVYTGDQNASLRVLAQRTSVTLLRSLARALQLEYGLSDRVIGGLLQQLGEQYAK